MITNGFTYDSAVRTLKLDPNWALLVDGETTDTTISNPKPEVDTGGDVEEAPENREVARRTNPKAELTDEDKLYNASRVLMQAQVDKAVTEYNESAQDSIKLQEATDDEIEAWIVAMMLVISVILLDQGKEGYAEGALIAGLGVGELNGFVLTETAENAYRTYLQKVATSYTNDTADAIRKVLAESNELGFSRAETEKALKNIMDTDDYRIRRLARTELNNSQNMGKLEGMKSLATEAGGVWEKTIEHTGKNPCELCASQEGIWTAIDTPLWGLGDTISTVNDKGETVVYVNNFQDNQANDYHPNGKGSLVFRRVD